MKKWLLGLSGAALLFSLVTGCSTNSTPENAQLASGTQSTTQPSTPVESASTEPMVLHWSVTGEPPTMVPGIATDAHRHPHIGMESI